MGAPMFIVFPKEIVEALTSPAFWIIWVIGMAVFLFFEWRSDNE